MYLFWKRISFLLTALNHLIDTALHAWELDLVGRDSLLKHTVLSLSGIWQYLVQPTGFLWTRGYLDVKYHAF